MDMFALLKQVNIVTNLWEIFFYDKNKFKQWIISYRLIHLWDLEVNAQVKITYPYSHPKM